MSTDERSKEEIIHALHEAEERFDNLFEGLGDSLAIVDVKNSQILHVNSHLLRRLGYSRTELLTMTFNDIVVKNEADDHLSWVSTFSGTNVYECHIRRKDGVLVPVEVSSCLSQYNKLPVFLNSIRESVIRKQAEQERLELKIERERVQILANFITKSSHEFRTPLSIIKLSTHLIGNSELNPKQQEYFEKINKQADHITQLVEALNNMAQLNETHEIALTEVDLQSVFYETIINWQNKLSDTDIRINIDFVEQPIVLMVNPELLSKALRELIENAVSALSNTGIVEISVSRTGDHSICIEVRDNGMGISPEHLPHIFESFYRVDDVGTTRGFGLGLPIAKRIIELHKGSIEMESGLNFGTTVQVILPTIR